MRQEWGSPGRSGALSEQGRLGTEDRALGGKLTAMHWAASGLSVSWRTQGPGGRGSPGHEHHRGAGGIPQAGHSCTLGKDQLLLLVLLLFKSDKDDTLKTTKMNG